MRNLEIQNQQGESLGKYPIFREYKFYVNGELTEPVNGVVKLAANSTYVLSGTLCGRIEIGDTIHEVDNDTYITLDGLCVITDDKVGRGISYEPTEQTLIVNIGKNKLNTIICDYEAEIAEKQGACLYSENNMVLVGSGYLSVVNKGGHGIKASELKISGNPHIYASANHDGIHGNSSLKICGGYYYVDGANDAFGTGSTGKIEVYNGTFRCFNIKQNAFDSKVAGYYLDKLDLLSDASVIGMSAIDPSSYFGVGKVFDNETEVTQTSGVYHCTTTSVKVQGYVRGQIELGTASTDVILDNCMIESTLDCIKYTPTSKKVQVTSAKDTTNILKSQSGSGINSSNNVVVEVKGGSHMIVNVGQYGINGSEITIHDSNGVLFVEHSGTDCIHGTDIYLACSADWVSGKNTDAANEIVSGSIILTGGNGYDIHARKTSQGKKANITVVDSLLKGCVYIGKVKADSGSIDTKGIDFGGSSHVCFKSVEGDLLKGMTAECSEPFNAYPIDKSVPV